MFGQGGGSQAATAPAGPAIRRMFGGMFGSGSFGQPSGGFRGSGGPTGPRRHRDHDARLHHGDQGRHDQAADRRRASRSACKIPAGVADGQKIRLRGKGQPSPTAASPATSSLTVTVRKHPVFERDGLNLRVDVPVTFVEAALGATIEVPTLGGDPVKLRVAPGTPSGRVLRVKGRGVDDGEGHRRPAGRRAGRRADASRRGERARRSSKAVRASAGCPKREPPRRPLAR